MRFTTIAIAPIFVFVVAICLESTSQAQLRKRLCPKIFPGNVVPLQEYCPPATDYLDPSQFLEPDNNDQFLDPEQFLNAEPQPSSGTPNLSIPSQDANLFASNPSAGEAGGLGQRGFIAGNQFFSPALISGPFFEGGTGEGFTVPIAGGDRRVKLSDQFNPFPINRVFYNFHRFGTATTDVLGNKVDLVRHTIGVERTFLNQNASIEMRIPFQFGVSAKQDQFDTTDLPQVSGQLGNIAISTKLLLSSNEKWSQAVGLALQFPTAASGEVFEGDDLVLRVSNQTVNLLPYFTVNFNPTQRTWATFFSQFDFVMSGDRVSSFVDSTDIFSVSSFSSASSIYSSTPLASEKYNQQHLFSIDASIGHWFYQNSNAPLLRGLAAFAELHHTTTLNDSDSVTAGDISFSNLLENTENRIDILDTAIGLRAQLGAKTIVTAAFVAPLRSGADKTFDSEFNLNVSRYIGR